MSWSAKHPVLVLVLAWGGLLVLTALSYAIARADVAAWGLTSALAVAAAKASVIGVAFLHLGQHRGAPRIVAATAIVFVALLVAGVMVDVETGRGSGR